MLVVSCICMMPIAYECVCVMCVCDARASSWGIVHGLVFAYAWVISLSLVDADALASHRVDWSALHLSDLSRCIR